MYDHGWDLPDVRRTYRLRGTERCNEACCDESCVETATVTITVRRVWFSNKYDDTVDYCCWWDVDGPDGLTITGLHTEAIACRMVLAFIDESAWERDLDEEAYDRQAANEIRNGLNY